MITSKPFQGLKQYDLTINKSGKGAMITSKPFQGLKQILIQSLHPEPPAMITSKPGASIGWGSRGWE